MGGGMIRAAVAAGALALAFAAPALAQTPMSGPLSGPVPVAGKVSLADGAAFFAALPEDAFREAVMSGTGQFTRWAHFCAEGLAPAPDGPPIDPVRLVVPDLVLEDRHAGNVGCALIEAGRWPLGIDRTGDGRAAIPLLGADGSLVGRGTYDLTAIGVQSAQDKLAADAAVAAEPGCAQTRACAVPACAPARRDNALLREALFSPDTKADICATLERWHTERHPAEAPTDDVARRAMILALQAAMPEQDVTDGLSRVVVEHSRAGTRFIAFNEIAPALFTIPLQVQTIRDASVGRCTGDAQALSCDVTVTVEIFSRAAHMPDSVQKVLAEAMLGPPRTYDTETTVIFTRRNARWDIADPQAALEAALDWSDALIAKGPVEYFIEGIKEHSR